MSNQTLAEIGAAFAEIEAMLDESEGEVTPAIEVALAAWNLSAADKVDAIGYIVKDLRSRAEAVKSLRDELGVKESRFRARAAWLTGYVERFAQERGLREVCGRIERFSYRKHGGVAPLVGPGIEDPALLPAQHQVTTVTANKESLRNALACGDPIVGPDLAPVAWVGERGQSFGVR